MPSTSSPLFLAPVSAADEAGLAAGQVAAGVDVQATGAPSRPSKRTLMATLRLFCIRVLNYVTNHVVAYVPSFTLRHLWYRRALGIELGHHASVFMGTYMWFNG